MTDIPLSIKKLYALSFLSIHHTAFVRQKRKRVKRLWSGSFIKILSRNKGLSFGFLLLLFVGGAFLPQPAFFIYSFLFILFSLFYDPTCNGKTLSSIFPKTNLSRRTRLQMLWCIPPSSAFEICLPISDTVTSLDPTIAIFIITSNEFIVYLI